MANETNKFIRYIDQLIPFLEASPTWFKIWIYILIFLIFVTIAGMVILYLTSQEAKRAKISLKYFSIERPKDNEEIPLGESQSWLFHGHFPIVNDRELIGTDNVRIEVFSLPDKQQIEQTGTTRISTVEGEWFFDSVKFFGEGLYEIIATGILGGQEVFRRIKVKCIEKAKAFKQSIEKDRRIRGVSKLVLLSPKEVTLPTEQELKHKLNQMQMEFFNSFPKNIDASMKVVSDTLDFVDRLLIIYPNDLYIKNIRAYSFKNYAMVMRRLNRTKEFERALDEAARMFEAILEQDTENAGAWNGLGSIALLRRHPRRALFYINRALEINPNYQAALHDKDIANRMLKDQNVR